MANPAPTINQINAFNATQGTIIDFNIIGGTELVRSNRIYIYDLSDNSLICTHLYVSTESIHELPANTDSSIVYESGKSSADFVNGAQYYAQIQTYTDTAGTEGGSGLSVAKMFWCLVNPTLTITTIPSTISTTSYNVSATYNANTSVVSNIIQQYQFNLYSATGSLLQSSGVVVGSGTQQGTSTAYDISYNFTGLSVGSSYYVVVDVTTTQGMNVSTQSNTFTVSIDTPTLGEATVVNNACDGYISVTSNLSGEYGGSASGEIASFVTSSVNDISSLKVTLDPIQDGTPWIGTDHDNTPYLRRAMPTQSNDYNRESGILIGGTVGWNQLIDHGNFDEATGWSSAGYGTITVANNIGTLTISDSSGSARIERVFTPIVGHKYLAYMDFKPSFDGNPFMSFQAGSYASQIGRTSVSAGNWVRCIGIRNVVLDDATSGRIRYYFGTTNVSVGDTVQFRNAGLIDLTALFGTTIADYIYSLEQATAGAGVAWFRRYFPEDYYPYSANTLQSVQATAHKTYDADENVIGNYALDSSLTLRGIPKLDSGNLYYDGDTYASDGTVTRRYKSLVLDGTNVKLSGTFGSAANGYAVYKSMDIPSNARRDGNLISDRFTCSYSGIDYMPLMSFVGQSGATSTVSFILPSSVTSLDEANAWFASNPTTIVYELATSTTETAQAYTNPQVVDPDGTEEYVTANYVPVGHDSTYSLVCPISGWDEVETYDDPVYGGTVGWNQLVQNGDFANDTGWGTRYATISIADGIATFTPSSEGTVRGIVQGNMGEDAKANHKYLGLATVKPPKQVQMNLSLVGSGGGRTIIPANVWTTFGQVFTYSNPAFKERLAVYCDTNLTTSDIVQVRNAQLFDLTAMFGSTKADEIYAMEQAQAGSGVAYFKLLFPKDYYEYNAGEETTVSAVNGDPYWKVTTDLPQTVYGGTLDVVSGVLTVDRASVELEDLDWSDSTSTRYVSKTVPGMVAVPSSTTLPNMIAEQYSVVKWSDGLANNHDSIAVSNNNQARLYLYKDADTQPPTGKIVYKLATPTTIQCDPQTVQTLIGDNNVWGDGTVEVVYNIPITNLLVKRQDIADVSGTWLTLYSQPITQASDMDFTFIDFLNQYGKTYKYALVPLLTQTQSDVEVEVEGGYTVSDEVQSIFDGVFIADQTGLQKCKANVGYGDVDMNQSVGTITPIGAKYPVVITNSKNQYHNGSISGTIVPDDYYFNGNLSRIDMVNKRNELEQFLTNKRAKIIKDWNSNIWLVMIIDNINCSFDNNYGMGMVNFNASWIEVGDPTNQQDLQAAGLIDVGGV